MSHKFKIGKPAILATLVCLFLLPLGCRKSARLKHCLQTQIPSLLQEVGPVPTEKRSAFLRRQLIKRCRLPLPLHSLLGYFSLDDKNTEEDRNDKVSRSQLWYQSARQDKEVRRAFARYRRVGCPQLSTRDFHYICGSFPPQWEIVVLANSCREMAERFLPKRVWIESFRLVPFLTTVYTFVALREFGVPEKVAQRYVALAALEQSHFRGIPLLPSRARQLNPGSLYEHVWVALHRDKVTLRGQWTTRLVDGAREQRASRLIRALFYQGGDILRKNRKRCKSLEAYGWFEQPTNRQERDFRKAWRRLFTAKQRQRFPVHKKCVSAIERWFLYIHPETHFQTIMDVLYTAHQLGWKGAHIVVGQDKVPFVGAAHIIPVSLYVRRHKQSLRLPKKMLHWAITRDQNRFFLHTKNEAMAASLRSLLHQNRRVPRFSLRGSHHTPDHAFSFGRGGGMYGGGGGYGSGGWGYGSGGGYGGSIYGRRQMKGKGRPMPLPMWLSNDVFSDAIELSQKPVFSARRQVFLTADKATRYRRLHTVIESMRSPQGVLPRIWLSRTR